jgi:hypothetical protein
MAAADLAQQYQAILVRQAKIEHDRAYFMVAENVKSVADSPYAIGREAAL